MESEMQNAPDHEILPETHSPMYLMHKYWARKPANIVRYYITKYCPEGGVVLDPFMGSGVSILESLLEGRFAVGVDINPLALFIAKNTGSNIDINAFKNTFHQLLTEIQKPESIYENLYKVNCPNCNGNAFLSHILWKNNPPQILEIRLKCEKCKEIRLEKEKNAPNFDEISAFILKQEQQAVKLAKEKNIEIPSFQFQYPSAQNFIQLRHNLRKHPDMSELFSHRNLVMLSRIRQLIMNLPANKILEKELLLFCLTSSIGQASKMVWTIDQRKGVKLEKPQVGSWTHHFFWDPSTFFEVNAWACFQERYKKILQGKKDALQRFQSDRALPFNLAPSTQNLTRENPVFLIHSPAQKLDIPDNSIDFIFTDPPYGDSIQYGELSSLWAVFLGEDMRKYLESTVANEIVMNSKQEKSLDTYQGMLKTVFKECFRVLKPTSMIVLTFHNTSLQIRNALVLAALEAGFNLCQILFQMPPRVSIKSMLHHSGSPVGDYYIRFQKPKNGSIPINKATEKKPLQDHTKIYRIIKGFFEDILKQRGEPTPFLWISNFLDEYLFKQGLFPLPEIENYIKKLHDSGEFEIDKMQRWWFQKDQEPKDIEPPLTEKIEKFLVNSIPQLKRELEKNQKTEKQLLYNLIYANFRGVLTPDKLIVTKIMEKKIN